MPASKERRLGKEINKRKKQFKEPRKQHCFMGFCEKIAETQEREIERERHTQEAAFHEEQKAVQNPYIHSHGRTFSACRNKRKKKGGVVYKPPLILIKKTKPET